MPILHVRGVSEGLYQELQELAQEQQRSISAQVIALLERAVTDEQRRRQQGALLTDIRRRRFAPPAGAVDSLALLREDRAR